MRKLELEKTPRGFLVGVFEDLYGSTCSIQESSLADKDAIWLGVERPSPDYDRDRVGETGGVRMHLDRSMAKRLLPHLQRFVDTGRLK